MYSVVLTTKHTTAATNAHLATNKWTILKRHIRIPFFPVTPLLPSVALSSSSLSLSPFTWRSNARYAVLSRRVSSSSQQAFEPAWLRRGWSGCRGSIVSLFPSFPSSKSKSNPGPRGYLRTRTNEDTAGGKRGKLTRNVGRSLAD